MLPFLKKLFGIKSSEEIVVPNEASHINQEVYKKSVELSERNKTLLLLRKIDEIILSSVTDKIEIAKRVLELLISETDIQIAAIFNYEKELKILRRLAIYETGKVHESNIKNSVPQNYITQLKIDDIDNLIVQSFLEKIPKSANSWQNVLVKYEKIDIANQFQSEIGIKSIFIYPLVVRGETIGSIVVAMTNEEQDITDYTKDLLDRLVQVIGIALDNAALYIDLQSANEKLKGLDKLKDEFVSLASHELRTPMTAIKSYLWMLLKGEAGKLNEEQNLYLQRAYSSTDRLIKLVNDMLNISRIESGRITLEMNSVNIQGLVKEVIDEINPRILELGINLKINYVQNLPNVFADAHKIKEVLYNLIGNSLKFTSRGGSITISFSENSGMIETKIGDTGSGISKENISKLFKKFNMMNESYVNNKNASGSGLGLYISYSIIDLHNGKMWATSEGIGKGSQFYFTLKIFTNKDINKLNEMDKIEESEKIGIVHTRV